MATVTGDLDRHASGEAAALVLRVVDVQKSFRRGVWPRRRRVGVLRGASLEVRSGELVGLVGENGSGKSTLMQIIVGLLGRDGGLVEQPARLRYCPQLPMLWDKLTVDEHFELFAHAYGLDDAARQHSVEALLDELQFARYRGPSGRGAVRRDAAEAKHRARADARARAAVAR